jgi:hypothetical protein
LNPDHAISQMEHTKEIMEKAIEVRHHQYTRCEMLL